TVKDRKQVWAVFEQVLKTLQAQKASDWSGICHYAIQLLNTGKVESPFDAVIVDELQDLGSQEIKLLAALAGEGPNRLMLLGDAGQRIYAGRTSLKRLGIDVRGRSHILRINYRTTEQIRSFADQVVGDRRDDLDGEEEERKGTISLLQGPEPTIQGFKTQPQQLQFITNQINQLLKQGVALDEIAIFARTNDALNAIESCLEKTKLASQRLSHDREPQPNALNLGTMHRAKGLEFKVVFIANLSDDQMPFTYLVNQMPDQPSREAALERERQLLYVSATRARDEVFATWVGQPSRFLEQLLTVPTQVKG
ncbi:UvrD-helicase domain-containing protein, partial [Pseudanabaenaceae cyanobacterium LEGE 13415]|nr:UvrD-helicase domain-containing protein [Pseudanabaenaceae cyanobacterium LEGE 13415]